MAEPEGPENRARVHWSVPPPPAQASEPSSRRSGPPLGDEFLFHLYRGSELLKDDQVYEAKGELERAIALQPRDVEGQSLLGVVYFRLGHYPRAIQIYEDLVRARPAEVAPRVNLALCYLKTGQVASARTLFEEIVHHRPDHLRAWGYLGLAHQRMGDLDKAAVAFDRAGRTELAARLRAARAPLPHEGPPSVPPPSLSGVMEIAQEDASAALTAPALPADSTEMDRLPPSRRGGFPAPAPATRVSLPASMSQSIQSAALVFPEDPRVVLHEGGSVLARIDRSFHLRADCVRALLPEGAGALRSSALPRPGRGLAGDDGFVGLFSPFSTIEGRGRLVLGVPPTFMPFLAPLDGEALYVREDRLVGFDGSIAHHLGRLSVAENESAGLMQLSGAGFVVLAIRGPLTALEVLPERPVQLRADRLVGWVGRLLGHSVPRSEAPGGVNGLVALSGTGAVLFDSG